MSAYKASPPVTARKTAPCRSASASADALGSGDSAGSSEDPVAGDYVASALALSWSNSVWVIAPDSKSSLPLAISSVGEPDDATERT